MVKNRVPTELVCPVNVGQYRDRGTGSLMEWGHVHMAIYTSHIIIHSYTSVVWRETHLTTETEPMKHIFAILNKNVFF